MSLNIQCIRGIFFIKVDVYTCIAHTGAKNYGGRFRQAGIIQCIHSRHAITIT